MQKRYLFVKQRKRFSYRTLAVAVIAGSLTAGLFMYWKRPNIKGSTLPLSQQKQQKNDLPDTGDNLAAVTLPKDGLSKLMVPLQQKAIEELNTFSVPEQFKGQILYSINLPSNDKVIALTFDDGPWPKSTIEILKILKQNNIKATFFVVGKPLKEYPQIAQLVVADGHVIGNHTWHHWYKKMDSATAAAEIEDTKALIYKTIGVKTEIFRPPGGILNNGVVDYAKKQKYFIAMWSADSMDYSRLPVDRLIHNVLKDAHPGGMVLMHDGGGDRSHTVEGLPKIIADLKRQGYKFVTVPELLEMQDLELKSQKPPLSSPAQEKTKATGIGKSPGDKGKKP